MLVKLKLTLCNDLTGQVFKDLDFFLTIKLTENLIIKLIKFFLTSGWMRKEKGDLPWFQAGQCKGFSLSLVIVGGLVNEKSSHSGNGNNQV